METIKQAKTFLRNNFVDGVDCPCCGQLVKLYRRKIHSEMGFFILSLVRSWKDSQRPHHIRELVDSKAKHSSDGAYLSHWDLLEKSDSSDKMHRGGMYEPTDRGIAFVEGRLRVPSHVYLYRNKVYGWSDSTTNIKEVLGNKFDYAELMYDRAAR